MDMNGLSRLTQPVLCLFKLNSYRLGVFKSYIYSVFRCISLARNSGGVNNLNFVGSEAKRNGKFTLFSHIGNGNKAVFIVLKANAVKRSVT